MDWVAGRKRLSGIMPHIREYTDEPPLLVVFLSSTSEFVAEREAIRTQLNDLIALRMYEREAPSGTESLNEEIVRWLDESHAVVGIYGRESGFVPEGCAQSVTELEFDLALKKGKPFYANVRKGVLSDQALTDGQRMFLKKLMNPTNGRRISEFSNAPELLDSVRRTLHALVRRVLDASVRLESRVHGRNWASAILLCGCVLLALIILASVFRQQGIAGLIFR